MTATVGAHSEALISLRKSKCCRHTTALLDGCSHAAEGPACGMRHSRRVSRTCLIAPRETAIGLCSPGDRRAGCGGGRDGRSAERAANCEQRRSTFVSEVPLICPVNLTRDVVSDENLGADFTLPRTKRQRIGESLRGASQRNSVCRLGVEAAATSQTPTAV